ncbi:MAG: hypothetical protein WC910_07125 [Bacteroidales bacterium]|jgi:DNA-directed RNA polymerase specialized sigma subunit
MPATDTKSPWASQESLAAATKAQQKAPRSSTDIWKTWIKDGSGQTELLSSLKSTVNSALHSYAPGQEQQLKIPAMRMALEAAKRYNPSSGAALNTFVFSNLQSLRRLSAERKMVVHVPENVRLEQGNINKAVKEYSAEYGREPDVNELADLTGYSTGRLKKLENYNLPVPEGSMLNEKGDITMRADHNTDSILQKYVYQSLDPINQRIYAMASGMNGAPVAGKDIAKRLKITPAAVSQRISTIKNTISKAMQVI